jgi:hypothetical protein
MRLQRFPAGVKPLEADLNALSDNSLEGIQDLIAVFSGNSSGSVLFDATGPDATVVDNVLSVTAPGQRVAIGGAVETSATYFEAYDVSSTSRYVEIFFVISRAPVTATRNFLSLDTDSGSTILQNLLAEIAEITNVRVVFLTQTSVPVGGYNSLELTLNANDLGFARLGSVFYDQPLDDTTIELDDTFKFAFPSDPTLEIPEVPVVDGSSNGLMTPALRATTLGALQQINVDSDSPFLSFAGAGDNGAEGAKRVTASLSYGEGMTVQNGQLAPDFLIPSAANGQTTKVARADHVHALSQSGIVRVVKSFSLSANRFGQLAEVTIGPGDLPENVTISEIMNVELMWAPSQSNPGRVELGWVNLSGGGTVGARAYISDPTTVRIEIGSLGAVEFTSPAAIELVESWNNNQSVGAYPSTGTIYVNILGLRDGANG